MTSRIKTFNPTSNLSLRNLEQRITLSAKLCNWCLSEETSDISTGVEIVKKLVKEGARYEDLDTVVHKAVDLCLKKNLEAAQNAHKLFEAMGDLTQTNGYVAYHFALCKFNLYKMQAFTTRLRQKLKPYLKEAEYYVHKALLLTNEVSSRQSISSALLNLFPTINHQEVNRRKDHYIL